MAHRIGEILDEEGEIVGYEYSDGSKRTPRGGWMEKPPNSAPIITKDNAAELANKRWEATRKAVDKGIAALVAETGKAGALDEQTLDAIERISTAQATLAIDTQAGHASTKAAEFLLRAADRLPDRRQAAPQAVIAIQVNISPELAASDWQDEDDG